MLHLGTSWRAKHWDNFFPPIQNTGVFNTLQLIHLCRKLIFGRGELFFTSAIFILRGLNSHLRCCGGVEAR